MVNKKAQIRIIEAVVAVLLIASVILIFNVQKTPKVDTSQEIYNLESKVLDSIESNATMREAVIVHNESALRSYVFPKIPTNLNFTIVVCGVVDMCSLPDIKNINVNIYADERIISSTLQTYAPKKVKIFVWEK